MLHLELEQRVRAAVKSVLPDVVLDRVLVRPSNDARFGDYQCTSLMAIAKDRRTNPVALANQVAAKVEVSDLGFPPSVAGAGFLNFQVKPEAVCTALEAAARGDHLFFQKSAHPRSIIIDFSSPNVAKTMHVGHIRSTVLGDTLSRVFRLIGHRVITDNHLGDWGTQFGMLILGWKEQPNRVHAAANPLAELELLYKEMNARCEADASVLEAARSELVRLQQGDPVNRGLWHEMIRISQAEFDSIYRRLDISFDHTLGESFYNPRLESVVHELVERGIARESEGAVAIFSDGLLPPKEDPFLIQRDGEWHANPLLIRKSDGGFNYATTDLATLQYRLETWSPNEIVYVTDGRQQLHFRQLFAAFKRWQPETFARVHIAHVWFGSILGEDGKPFKTRSGETVKLAGLLDEAELRSFDVVSQKNPELPESQRREIARVVGIGAVKYADLLPSRHTDYVFSWDKLLSLSGNTAPYLQYASTRIRSIFRKAGETASLSEIRPGSLALSEPAELALAKRLLHFGIVLEAVADEYRPNLLCNYIYEVAGLFARFYEACPVLKAPEPHRQTRLVLCDLTSRVLQKGLDTLGIRVTDVM